MNLIDKMNELSRQNISFVLATVVEAVKSTPGRTGFKMIITRDGESWGTVGGGNVERQVQNKAAEMFDTRENQLLNYKLTEEETSPGMICGGEIRIFLEYIKAETRIILFGAGHLCRSLVPVLNLMNYQTVIVDDRDGFANKEQIPRGDEFYTVDYTEFIKTFKFAEEDSVVIFTHAHKSDSVILEALLEKGVELKYCGMIGSKHKVAATLKPLKERFPNSELLKNLFAPIGLNIANRTTTEIAVSIAAEILGVLNGVEKVDNMRNKETNCENN